VNFKLTLQYDGTDFHGWQIQGELRTIQGELTQALSLIEGQPVNVHGSGRTDAGVHAEGQVASVNLSRTISCDKLRAAINANVGKDLRVLQVEHADDDFHARYTARGKTYVYRILNSTVASPFWMRYAYHEARDLELERMKSAAELFVGKHDWTAFSAAQSDVEDRVRIIRKLELASIDDERARGRLITITVSADGFLRYMVRAIAGGLMAVGRGDIDNSVISDAIENAHRHRLIATAPACGLTLVSVRYDQET
jgi:tRNA pseudouridine38-40 synthase